MTFASGFSTGHNSLNAIRLVLAVLVIVSHSWPLGGYGTDPGWGDLDIGDWALAGFFVISGYLITMSSERSSGFFDYIWRRFLRIYPGFLVCLLVTGLVIAPLASVLLGAGDYSISSGLYFIFSNLALYITQYGIPGTLETVPFPGAWNGPLWSLAYEFACYLGVGLLASLIPARHRRLAILVVFLACTAVTAIHSFGAVELPDLMERLARLGAAFFAGATLYMFRHHIPFSRRLAAVCGVVLVALMATGTAGVFAGIPLAYLLMVLGATLPFQSVGSKTDISYGMYIYAFPIQQCIALAFGLEGVSVWSFILLSVALTVPLAWASFLLVEKPALRLKRLTASRVLFSNGLGK